MIDARVAHQLANESDEVTKARVERVGQKIEEAAREGKRFIYLDYALAYENWTIVEQLPFRPAELTPVQRLVCQRLEQDFSFHVSIVAVPTKIGGGLGSLDEESHIEDVYHIKVSW